MVQHIHQQDSSNASFGTLLSLVDKASNSLDLDLNLEQRRLLVIYLLELEKWNKTYNLTAIRTVDDMLVQHIIDCLAILPAIDQYQIEQKLDLRTIIDVGSGAGLPGVVIAIVNNDMQVTCIDAVHKKHAFVSHIANKLGLNNLRSVHARIETVSNMKADLIISRAFSSLASFVAQVEHLLSAPGVIAAMKAKQVETEIKEFESMHSAYQVDRLVELKVPQLKAKRFLVWVRRKSHE
jgi:16S rRNA (guanine527-N7)-methyltransferase